MDAVALVSLWWEKYNPYVTSKIENIESGQRNSIGSKQEHYTAPCQYWVKALPSVCMNFKKDENGSWRCTLQPGQDQPSGYGNDGGCDGIGRRSWCDAYMESEEFDPNLYTCVAPSVEKSGTGKTVVTSDGIMVTEAWSREEIKGFNEDTEGNHGCGQCDGIGMGRGSGGIGITDPEEMYKKRRVCNLYRPWIMGFGAIVPRPFHGGANSWIDGVTYLPTDSMELHDGSDADPLTPVKRRLPFALEIYNARSQFQKCAYWDMEWGAQFVYDHEFYNEIVVSYSSDAIDTLDPIDFCTKWTEDGEESVKKFLQPTEGGSDFVPRIIKNIWSDEAGGVVCNGACPGCPCYTGKWLFCVDEKMRDGMRITADQVFELRFWANNWTSQEEYDNFFEEKPGPTQNGEADETTADIYTFTHWENMGEDPNESIMHGIKHHMCMPAPLNNREFNSKIYVTKTPVRYPKTRESIGTRGPADVRFPTLVRALPDMSAILPPLEVVYPYFSDGVWEMVPCEDYEAQQSPYRMISTCMDELPGVVVVGYTIRYGEVYAINRDLSGKGPLDKYLSEYARTQSMLNDKGYGYYEKFNAAAKEWLETLNKDAPDSFVSCVSGKYGEFCLGPVHLKRNQDNQILILVKWGYDQFLFCKRVVVCDFYGGLMLQDSFTHELAASGSYDDTLPVRYPANVSASGRVINIGYESMVSNIFSVYSYHRYDIFGGSKVYQSYCINEYDGLEIVERWTPVGQTGYVWADLEDTNLSYIFEWKIEEATMIYNHSESSNLCGWPEKEVTLDVVFPMEISESGQKNASQKRVHSGPGCVLLKASKPYAFFNSDWILLIKYKYQLLEPRKPEKTGRVAWPPGLDQGYDPPQVFVKSPYTVVYEEGNSFSIPFAGTVAGTGTMAVIGFISNSKDGRVYAAAATKLLGQVGYIKCRSVDIDYKYRAQASSFRLEPHSGFMTTRGADSIVNMTKYHARSAPCGDHECGVPCIGPMWFPYLTCGTDNNYMFYCGAGNCTGPLVNRKAGIKLQDWRFCTTDEFEAWVSPGGNWASTCGSRWTHFYSWAPMKNVELTGRGKKKTSVDVAYYKAMGWTLPPFGNAGREYMERWFSQDFTSFIDRSGPIPEVKSEYMPMVIDNTQFFYGLNSFVVPQKYSPDGTPFSFQPQMSFLLASHVKEEVAGEEARLRWDEVFKELYQGNCMYPFPVYSTKLSTYIVRYGFRDESLCWAWPELWKDLERNVESPDGVRFRFMDLIRPEYYIDYHKVEHRLITDEGESTILFKAPVIENGEVVKYPSISINGWHERFFKILYKEDEYDTRLVDWVDDSAEGFVDGSGGESGGEEGSIYEDAMGDDWLHDPNTIFDQYAEREKADDRKACVGIDMDYTPIYKYYNQGLVANIPRNRLIYLPINESDAGESTYTTREPSEDGFYHYDSDLGWPTWAWDNIPLEDGVVRTPIEMIIKGKWGSTTDAYSASWEKSNTVIVSKPTVAYGEYDPEDLDSSEGEVPPFPGIMKYAAGTTGSSLKKPGLEEYEIRIRLSRDPIRMVKSTPHFQIKLSSTLGESLSVDQVAVKMGCYADSTEYLNVWERKYVVSTMSETGALNPEGKESQNVRSYDRDNRNRGQYFPPDYQPEAGSFKAVDKITMIGAAKRADHDEDLSITIDTLSEMEYSEQMLLYVEPANFDVYKELKYAYILPPALAKFFKDNGIGSSLEGEITFKCDTISWGNSSINNKYLKSEKGPWQPGGHKFQWSPAWYETRCFLFGDIEKVYSVEFVHVRHGAGAVPIMEPPEAYAGWGRLDYAEGVLRIMGFDGYGTDLMTSAQYGTEQYRSLYRP